jgi:5-methylcytosine-specific restriction protein A
MRSSRADPGRRHHVRAGYVGEGQVGDMRFVAGNKAIRDHAHTGKDLHLFEIVPKRKGVRFIGQMVNAGYDLVPNVPDMHGRARRAIAFHLAPLDTTIASPDEPEQTEDEVRELSAMWTAPLEQLRARAEEQPAEGAPASQALRTTYRRSAAVRIYVLRRANGYCEGCGMPAPFLTGDGRPYLEPVSKLH